MRWRSRPFVVLPVSVLLAAPLVPAEAVAPAGVASLAPAGATSGRTVTLITGDRVEVRDGAVRVRPGPGRQNVGFRKEQAGPHVVVLPMDAAPLVAKGRVDRRLFDVGELLRSGQDDAHTGTLPVSVTGSGAKGLPGIAKSSATRFWQALASSPGDVRVRLRDGDDPKPRAAASEHGLKVDLLDRNGRTPDPESGAEWLAYSLDDPDMRKVGLPGETIRLPAGRYMVFGYVATDRPGTAYDASAMMVDTNVAVDRDHALTFDARKARRVEINADRPSARKTSWRVGMAVKAAPNADYTHFRYGMNLPFGSEAYVSATEPSARFGFSAEATYQEPLLRLEAGGAERFPVEVLYADFGFGDDPRLLGTNRLSAVYGGSGKPEELDGVAGKLVVLDPPPSDDPETPERVSNVARAGGRAVLLVRDTAGPHFRGTLELPTVVAHSSDGARLRDLVKAGQVPVTTHGIKASQYQYNLTYPTTGRLPDSLVYTPRRQDLAAIRVHYRGAPGSLLTETVGFGGSSGGWLVPVPAPISRTEYFTTGKDLRFTREFLSSMDDGRPAVRTETRSYLPGERRDETMNKGVLGPSFATSPRDQGYLLRRPAWAYRDGDTVDVSIPAFSGTEPGHYGYGEPGSPECTKGTARLFKDGKPAGESDRPAEGTFAVAPEAGAYRLDVEAACDRPDWTTSTVVTSSWTFRSARTSRPAPLPLMAVRYLPKLDELNRAPADRRFTFPVRVERQPGSGAAEVTSLAVEASGDGGKTWAPVRLRRDGDGWIAELRNPSKGGVSLRATAKDSSGGTVTQTIENAYTVRP